jgi:hypothetical protein
MNECPENLIFKVHADPICNRLDSTFFLSINVVLSHISNLFNANCLLNAGEELGKLQSCLFFLSQQLELQENEDNNKELGIILGEETDIDAALYFANIITDHLNEKHYNEMPYYVSRIVEILKSLKEEKCTKNIQ